MKLRHIVIGVVVVLVAVVVAGVAIVANMDFSQYKPLIAQKAKEATGRELAINGDLKLVLGLSPSLAVNDVTFANASGGSKPHMAEVKRFEVQVDLLPLLSGNIRVRRLVLANVDILLETDQRGRGNWEFVADKPATPAPSSGGSTGGSAAPANLPQVNEVEIRDARLVYRDGRENKTTQLALKQALLKADSDNSPLKLDIDGAYNDKRFQIAGNVGSIVALQSPGTPFPVSVTVRLADAASVKIDGQITEPLSGRGYDMRIVADAAEVAKLGELAGATIPALGPLKADLRLTDSGANRRPNIPTMKIELGRDDGLKLVAEGAIRDLLEQSGVTVDIAATAKDGSALVKQASLPLVLDGPIAVRARVADTGPQRYALSAIKLDAGGSDLGGEATLSLAGSKPAVTATLASTRLDIAKLMPESKPGARPSTPSSGGSSGAPSRGDGRLFSADPLPLDMLNMADADIRYKADLFQPAKGAAIKDFAVQAVVRGGELAVRQLAGEIGGGRIGGDLSLAQNGALTLKLSGKAIELGTLDQGLMGEELMTGGKTDLDADLRGRGTSMRALMASLDGSIFMHVGQGQVKSQLTDKLGFSELTRLIDNSMPKQDTTPFNCLVAKLDVRQGLATARAFVVDSARLTLDGSGNVNLASEQPALLFNTHTKTTNLLSLLPPIRVSGTLADPRFLPDVAGAATGLVGGVVSGAVRAPGDLLSTLRGQQQQRQQADACATALATATGRPAPAAPAPAAQPAAPAEQPGNPVDSIGRGLRGIFGR